MLTLTEHGYLGDLPQRYRYRHLIARELPWAQTCVLRSLLVRCHRRRVEAADRCVRGPTALANRRSYSRAPLASLSVQTLDVPWQCGQNMLGLGANCLHQMTRPRITAMIHPCNNAMPHPRNNTMPHLHEYSDHDMLLVTSTTDVVWLERRQVQKRSAKKVSPQGTKYMLCIREDFADALLCRSICTAVGDHTCVFAWSMDCIVSGAFQVQAIHQSPVSCEEACPQLPAHHAAE